MQGWADDASVPAAALVAAAAAAAVVKAALALAPALAAAAMAALGSLREFDAMMAFLREPPPGVVPDAYMYTQALQRADDLAQADARGNRPKRGAEGRQQKRQDLTGGSEEEIEVCV